MPLDLSRAENIGEEHEPPKPKSDLYKGNLSSRFRSLVLTGTYYEY